MDTQVTHANKGKRTNSLAFAPTDCHTCALLDEKCDRRRPQCSTCLGTGRNCGGFVTPLSWDSRRMWTEAPPTTQDAPSTTNVSNVSNKTSTPVVRFQFVGPRSSQRKRRRTNGHRSRSKLSVSTPQVDNARANGETHREPGAAGEKMDERAEAQISICSPPTFDALDTSFFNDLNLADLLMPNILESAPFFDFEQQMSSTADPQRAMALPETQPLAVPDQVTEYPPEEASDHGPSTSSATTELGFVVDTSAQQYNAGTNYLTSPSRPHGAPAFPEISPNESEWLLEMYDSEFCILPLTSDTSINPFRCQRQTSQGSRLLYHSILALCCQHLKRMTGSWSTEADDHRSKAAHLLDSALQSKQIQRSFHLLEPMLILFTLDCTLSAAGTWNAHLTRAHSMLQVCGGPSALTTPRVRSQVGMLLWWDTTLALISRRGPVMDQAYLDYLAYWEKKDEWSFFELTGCPRDLLVYLFHLAELARQNEIALSNKWLTFDMTPVLELEQKLLHWKDSDVSPLDETDHGFSDSEVEKQFYEEQDRYHCTEAWRCSLLLYLERVLKRDRRKRYVSIYRLVRTIFDHVRSCRQTSQTQKQLLLPVFLAGSETSDGEMQEFVKEYCLYWGEKSRYGMFNSVPTLLEEIWNTGKWWGSVVDSRTKPPISGQEQGAIQLLFG